MNLVTGSEGFIGSTLVKRFQRGHKPFIGWDLKNDHDIMQYEKFCTLKDGELETIYHLAARPMVQDSVKNPLETYQINVIGTLKMLELARKTGARFVFASTAQVKPIYEFDEEPLNPYALQKYNCELLIEQYSRLYGIDYTIYRIYNVFGPGEHGVIGKFLEARANEEALQVHGGSQKRDFIHVQDVVYQLMGLRENGTYELGSGKSISIKEVANMISNYQDYWPQDKNEPNEMEASKGLAKITVKEYLERV